jgi:hypothetical protein
LAVSLKELDRSAAISVAAVRSLSACGRGCEDDD